jgi:hypothetical protein
MELEGEGEVRATLVRSRDYFLEQKEEAQKAVSDYRRRMEVQEYYVRQLELKIKAINRALAGQSG